MIEIKENEAGNLHIKIDDKEYLNMPSSKPVKMICYNGGKGYEQGECYIRFFYLWQSDQEAYDECEYSQEYKERDFWFDKDETMFEFLQKYLSRFEWNDK